MTLANRTLSEYPFDQRKIRLMMRRHDSRRLGRRRRMAALALGAVVAYCHPYTAAAGVANSRLPVFSQGGDTVDSEDGVSSRN